MTIEIEHSGLKGMKWYQHKFGRWQTHAQYAGGQADPNAPKGRTKKEERILNSPRKLKRHYKEFSEEEVKQAIKNFETKQKLKQFTANDIKTGKEVLNNLASSIEAGIKGYNGAAAIYNAFTKSGKKLPKIETSSQSKKKNKKNNDDDDDD